jgi:uncharacterized protein YybS (DUF2232 family)
MVSTQRSGDFLRAWASTSALFLSGLFVPVGGVFLMLLTPQPGLRLERRAGMAPLLALVLLVTMTAGLVAGPMAGVFYLVGFALLTVLLPVTLRRDWSLEATVVVGTFALLVAVAGAAVSLVDSPGELLAGLERLLEQARAMLLATYQDSDPSRVEQVGEATAAFVRFVVGIAPALFVIALGATVLLNLLVVRWRQSEGTSTADLAAWSAPEPLVWVLIGSGYASFLPQPFLQGFGWNVFIVVLSVYFLHGLAIVAFLFRKWQTPAWLRVLVYAMLAIEWVFAAGVATLGVFDLWADFRRLQPRPDEEDEDFGE